MDLGAFRIQLRGADLPQFPKIPPELMSFPKGLSNKLRINDFANTFLEGMQEIGS